MRNFTATTLLCLAAGTLWIAPAATATSLDRSRVRLFSQYQPDATYDLASQPEANDSIGIALANGDFNGDGYMDLAIGSPNEDLGSGSQATRDSGWVTVLYGTPAGLDASSGFEDTWDQQGDVEGGVEPGDGVGRAVAVGDFNGDGFDDLVMGAPREDIGAPDNGGSINVLYGSAAGLTETANRQIWQGRSFDGATVPWTAEFGDNFGYSLAAGDFDGDGRDDLAVGAPFEDIRSNSLSNAGGVIILYGRDVLGLGAQRARGITRDSGGMTHSPNSSDWFGRTLAAGDLNGDGRDDLAIGVPGDDFGRSEVGSVDVVYGSPSGLDTQTTRTLFLSSLSVGRPTGTSDEFGSSLAIGNFDGDGFDDLAVGIPSRDADNAANAGAVTVIYGSALGTTGARSRYFAQGQAGLAGVQSSGDRFGSSLAAADFDGDLIDDLAIGALYESAVAGGTTIEAAGAVQILHGQSGSGLSAAQSEVLDYGVVGTPATNDLFGFALTGGDFNGDGADDLATSVLHRDVLDVNGQTIEDAGEVIVLPGILSDGPCAPTQTSLCLAGNRFRVEVDWGSDSNQGVALPRTADTGFFWFFNQENIEVVVKVLDARGVNGHFWVFYGSLSNVEYTLTVTDEETNEVRTYVNPAGTFASAGDTTAFADSGSGFLVPPTAARTAMAGTSFPLDFSQADETLDLEQIEEAMEGCQANQLALCLNNDRFFVQVDWRDFQGNRGDGQAVELTNDTGAFWFFDEANLELVLKVLDGTDINGHYWVFFGALTNIEYEISVLDTHTGRVVRYVNPANRFASEGDTTALPQ